MTPLARRVLLYNVVPPLTVCVLTGVWAIDQAAFLVRLIRAHRRSSRG